MLLFLLGSQMRAKHDSKRLITKLARKSRQLGNLILINSLHEYPHIHDSIDFFLNMLYKLIGGDAGSSRVEIGDFDVRGDARQ